MKDFRYKKAFSLAEVLIVIVILGIVMAMITGVINVQGSKTSHIALKRVYYGLTNTLEDVVNNSFFYTPDDDNPMILETPNTRMKSSVARILEIDESELNDDKTNWLCHTIAKKIQLRQDNCSACSTKRSLSFITSDRTAVFGLCGAPEDLDSIFIYVNSDKFPDKYGTVIEQADIDTIHQAIEEDTDDNAYELKIKTTGIILPGDERAKKILRNEKITKKTNPADGN